VISGRQLAPDFAQVHELIEYVLGHAVMTHVLPAVIEQVRPLLTAQFPQLEQVDCSSVTPESYLEWIDEIVASHGSLLEVKPLGD
jgi:hypothetical protein